MAMWWVICFFSSKIEALCYKDQYLIVGNQAPIFLGFFSGVPQVLIQVNPSLFWHVTLWLCQNSYWKWPLIVDFPIKNGDFQ